MAAAAEPAKPTSALGTTMSTTAGRSSTYDYAFAASSNPKKKLRLLTSTAPSSFSSSSSSKPKISAGNVYSAGASPASSTTQFPPRNDSRTAGPKKMSGSIPAGGRTESRHAKLHKRGGSGSSGPGSSLPRASGSLSQTPTYEESHTPSTGSLPKIRPYLRKMSTKDDTDQGRLDLSKSIAEHPTLSGLGIHDLHTTPLRSAADVPFAHTAKHPRDAHHARNTSGDSALSRTSTKQPFVHPMRQTPRPYTPPHAHSFDSTVPLNDDERNESDDVLTDDDFRLGAGFRSRRSVSVSSTPIMAPTPLSQSHTLADLGSVPKITGGPSSYTAVNSSQTNLSTTSSGFGGGVKESSSRPSFAGGRSRRNTDRSVDTTTASASARTSLDKAFSFASGGGVGGRGRSDTDPLTRDQRIENARREFEAREARKERKVEERVLKRRETEEEKLRRKSEVGERGKGPKKASGGERPRTREGGGGKGARVVEEKAPAERRRGEGTREGGGWGRFSTWVRMRVLSCGGKG